jgi:hypothetical protein
LKTPFSFCNAVACAFLALALSAVGCHKKDEAMLAPGSPGDTLEGPARLATALPIRNQGHEKAENVTVTSISLSGAALASPSTLPVSLGVIGRDEQASVFATFTGPQLVPGAMSLMTVEGTYTDDGRKRKFVVTHQMTIPPASPGSATVSSSSSPPNKVTGGNYPPQKPHFPSVVNEGFAWPVPAGTFRAPGPPSAESKTQPAPEGDPPGIDFFTNAALGINSSSVNEPSGGVGNGVVFVSANWFAAYSTDNGAHFTRLNPTAIFPNNADGGFCCDQIVVYAPTIDRVLWLMQFSRAALPTDPPGQANGPNRYRLAAASPATVKSSNGTAWTYWDITSLQLGYGNNWVDYPDMSLGNNSLYMSFDEVGVGRTVVRIPLAQIQASGTIFFQYTDPNNSPMGYGGHLTQDTQDEIFWAGHNSNSNMRVFSWQESSNTYFWRDIGVGTWPNDNSNLTSVTPDNQDWLTKLRNFPGNAVLGGTRVSSSAGKRGIDQIWFAWPAPSGNGFKQPHVQWVALDRNNNFNLITQAQIWNSSYAFSYPAFASNSNGEVGMSLEFGGGGNYENHVAGFWGDFIVYITTSSNLGVTRFGDTVTIRRDAGNPLRFDAFGYGMNKATPPATGGVSDTHYIVFGRP